MQSKWILFCVIAVLMWIVLPATLFYFGGKNQDEDLLIEHKKVRP